MLLRVTECCELICADPEIYRIRIPFENLGGGESNCYLVHSAGEWLMVDSGAYSLRSRRLLFTAMNAAGFDARNAVAFATHAHFDHSEAFIHLLGFSTPLMLSEKGYLSRTWKRCNDSQKLFARRMRAMGANFDDSCSYAAVNAETAVLDPASLDMRFVADGDVFSVGDLRFEVIETPGHTSDHLCLFERRLGLLFSGDAALEETAPSLDSQPGIEDGLHAYLESLDRLRRLPVAYALPGHGGVLRGFRAECSPVRGMATDVSGPDSFPMPSFLDVVEINASKKARKLERVRGAVAQMPFASGQQIARILVKASDVEEWHALPPDTRYYAMLEAFIMLQHLIRQGRVIRILDDYGVYRYTLKQVYCLM